MQNEQLIWSTEPAVENQSARSTSPSLSLDEVWACHRKMRIALASPRRPSCLISRTMVGRPRVAAAGASQAADRPRPATRLNESRVPLRAFRIPRALDETWPWVLLTLAAMVGLVTGFGAMGKLVENWTGFVSLIARCLG